MGHSRQTHQHPRRRALLPRIRFYVRRVRADLAALVDGCPLADDLIMIASELAANAIIRSSSHELDGEITVRALILRGDYA